MNIVEILPRTSNTNFHGATLPVLPDEEYLAADPDGGVWAFTSKPSVAQSLGCWTAPEGASPRRVARVDLQGHDWAQTLTEIDPIIEA